MEASEATGTASDWGYLKDIDTHFAFGRTLGRGGSGLVCVVRERATDQQFACKSIRKDLRENNQEVVRREVPFMLLCLKLGLKSPGTLLYASTVDSSESLESVNQPSSMPGSPAPRLS